MHPPQGAQTRSPMSNFYMHASLVQASLASRRRSKLQRPSRRGVRAAHDCTTYAVHFSRGYRTWRCFKGYTRTDEGRRIYARQQGGGSSAYSAGIEARDVQILRESDRHRSLVIHWNSCAGRRLVRERVMREERGVRAREVKARRGPSPTTLCLLPPGTAALRCSRCQHLDLRTPSRRPRRMETHRRRARK